MKRQETKASCSGIIHYFEKTVGFSFHPPELSKQLPEKSYAPNKILKHCGLTLLMGKHSGHDIEKVSNSSAKKFGIGSSPCRSTISALMSEERVAKYLSDQMWNMIDVNKRLRIDKLPGFGDKTLVTLDAIDQGEICKGKKPCGLCLPRVRNGITYYFHKAIVLSQCTTGGPTPIALRYVRPAEIEHLAPGISEEKFKTECELTGSRTLLQEVADREGGRLFFDILTADALFANAPYMEFIESLGAICIFAFKQEKRILYKEAKKDFLGQGFGLNLIEANWIDLANKRSLSSKEGVYEDKNRKEEDKSVKIVEIKRQQKDGLHTTMAITSDSKVITAKLVEQARLARWRDHENGIFNELTNGWKTGKHIFFHNKFAMISMMALMLLCLGASNLYKWRNLTRGGRKFSGTLRDFFDQILVSFYSMRSKRLASLFQHPPPLTD